jgi:hypothetical protein
MINAAGLHAHGQIDLQGTKTTSISLTQARIQGSLTLTGAEFHHDSVGAAAVELSGTNITGTLNLGFSQVFHPDGIALNADNAEVGGDMSCVKLRAMGEVRLLDARIGGALNLGNAELANHRGNALSFEGAEIGGSVFCRYGFVAEGRISMMGAHIGSTLEMQQADLKNRDGDGDVLRGDDVYIGGSMFCRQGFKAEGRISLAGAQIGGNLEFTEADLDNPDGATIAAWSARIGANVLCRELKSRGEIDLFGTTISGRLDLGRASLDCSKGKAIDLSHVCATRIVLPQKTAPVGEVDLTNSKVEHLEDGWPTVRCEARIRGLTYETLTPLDQSAKTRLQWLRGTPDGYHTQPYEQLASVLRRTGQVDAARAVVIAKERDRRPELKAVSRFFNSLLYLTVGYGYQAWRGLIGIVGTFIVGWIVFGLADKNHKIVPVHSTSHLQPAFHAWLYALDSTLPVINLRQEEYWSPTGFALYWHTLSVLAGWLLVTLILGALTSRLVRD